MRVDAKQEGPRQSMSWLHTWASLILGGTVANRLT